MKTHQRLVIVSNRVPSPVTATTESGERAGPVGGLVSALKPVVEQQRSLWFGWSGRSTGRSPDATPAFSGSEPLQMATLDLSEDEVSLYYTGFANRTLWPLLHSLPERATIRRDAYGAYRRVNRRFAEALRPLLRPDDLVWVNDFHLFHVGDELRQLGWAGKTGFFLHVPFPPAEISAILPWARQILEALTQYDLVGFQTKRYLSNAVDAFKTELGATNKSGKIAYDGRSFRVGVYPVGIDPSPYQRLASQPRRAAPDQRLILGVDRLDYTKGIPQRLRAFERLLEHNPSLRGKVSFMQISSPSRTRVPEYISEKEQVERLVGQINGRFSGANWMPIRYLYRTYQPERLARFYRDADVCVVTPLQDGMNLIAKEFVASQDDDPGVLVLSRFCGAAESMKEALIVNPHDIDGTAAAIYRALNLTRRERRERWEALMDGVCKQTAERWSDSFIKDLADPQP